MRGVIDTNLVIFLKSLSSDLIPDEPLIAAITLAELSIGPLATEPLPFDAAAARACGRVAASLRRSGRKPQARALDALIAATAMSHWLGG